MRQIDPKGKHGETGIKGPQRGTQELLEEIQSLNSKLAASLQSIHALQQSTDAKDAGKAELETRIRELNPKLHQSEELIQVL